MLRANLKKKIDSIIYGVHNGIYDILLFISPVKKYVRRNVQYKNKHLGEACVIMGNGPSLKHIDLDILRGKRTFVTNYFYKANLFAQFVPDYYTVIDESFYADLVNSTFEAMQKYPDTTFLFKHKCLRNFELMNALNRHKKFIVSYNQSVFYDGRIRFDFSKNLTASINTINHSINAALYMGFKKIYLIGCDFNTFTSRKSLYFYSDEHNPSINPLSLGDELLYYGAVAQHHYALNNKAKELGVEIINATEGTLLDAYPLGAIPVTNSSPADLQKTT